VTAARTFLWGGLIAPSEPNLERILAMDQNTVKGALIATAVAALFGCAESNQKAAAAPSGTGGSVKCLGINSCKGQGECSTADHSCGKHTPCKGHGWVTLPSADECAAKGGTIL
jgi:hypothetical protein